MTDYDEAYQEWVAAVRAARLLNQPLPDPPDPNPLPEDEIPPVGPPEEPALPDFFTVVKDSGGGG